MKIPYADDPPFRLTTNILQGILVLFSSLNFLDFLILSRGRREQQIFIHEKQTANTPCNWRRIFRHRGIVQKVCGSSSPKSPNSPPNQRNFDKNSDLIQILKRRNLFLLVLCPSFVVLFSQGQKIDSVVGFHERTFCFFFKNKHPPSSTSHDFPQDDGKKFSFIFWYPNSGAQELRRLKHLFFFCIYFSEISLSFSFPKREANVPCSIPFLLIFPSLLVKHQDHLSFQIDELN